MDQGLKFRLSSSVFAWWHNCCWLPLSLNAVKANEPDSGKPREPSPDKPTPDKPAPDKPAPDKPAPDKPAPDKPAPDKPAPDKPAPDKPAPDKPAPDKPAPDKPAPRRWQRPAADPRIRVPRALLQIEGDDPEHAAVFPRKFIAELNSADLQVSILEPWLLGIDLPDVGAIRTLTFIIVSWVMSRRIPNIHVRIGTQAFIVNVRSLESAVQLENWIAERGQPGY